MQRPSKEQPAAGDPVLLSVDTNLLSRLGHYWISWACFPVCHIEGISYSVNLRGPALLFPTTDYDLG